MPILESLAHRALLSLNAETAHELALSYICKGMGGERCSDDGDLSKTVFGVKFPNPVGLAAGFDKDGVAIEQWKRLGFGFVEVGTITRHAQPGNPKPRLFRIKPEHALINRMGFNNCGADEMARNLDGKDAGIPVGVNIGKSKVTPLDEAHEDYAYSFKLLKEFADYVVVNVSSPNTPGLRKLQDKDLLREILGGLKEIDSSKPLFVKIAPDLSLSATKDLVSVAKECDLTGMVCTNTTVSREHLLTNPLIEGGLSGAPLTLLADEALRITKDLCGDSLKLIGVGGIMNAADAKRKMELGADLVQIYTGWVYGGPGFVPKLIAGLKT